MSELSIKDEFDNQYRFIESGHPFLKGFLAFTGLSPGEYVILPAGGLAPVEKANTLFLEPGVPNGKLEFKIPIKRKR